MSDHHDDAKAYGLDKPGKVKLLMRVLIGFGALLAVGDFFYHKHPHFSVEEIPAFYAIFGFAAFVGIVLAGKYLRKILMRPENYYDE